MSSEEDLGFVKVAETSEIPSGKMKLINTQGKQILAANVDGIYHAIGARCTHKRVDLSKGTLWKNIVTCPLHRAKFDLTDGHVISGPTRKDEPSYKVKIEEKDILIEIS